MSTGLGTLQAPRQSLWPAMALALLVVMTVAIVATTLPASTAQPDGRFVGRPLVNTPSEIYAGVGAGFVGGTVNNTPSEMSGGGKSGPHGKATDTGPPHRLSSPAEWPQTADAIGAAERYRHQRI